MTVLRDYAAQLDQPTLPGSRGDLGGPGGPGGPGGERSEPVRFDEVVGPDGALRAPWRPLAEVAASLTAKDLRRVDDEIARALADDGVTYARPGQGPGPWRLDPVPLVIDAASWTPLEVGLAQRAELLNAVLVDLYGPQRLLADGIVPAAVVLGHPGFIRSVARPSQIDPRPLVLSATDLGRDASGEWRVLGDKAQAPSGIGYAMENRRVISRVVPELYRQAGMHRMEPYFWALRSALIQSANGDLADPRVVVLSPGTASETSYDQAFIATTLGFPLVQGSDLLVRDGWVYLRSPSSRGRLERVDVILRRVDAAWTDPLELRGRLPARRRRPDRGGTPRPGPGRQRPRRRGPGEPGAAALPAGRLRGAAGRAAAAGVGAHLVVRGPGRAGGGPRTTLATRPDAGAAPPGRPRRARRPRPRSCGTGCWPSRTATSGRSGRCCPRPPPGARPVRTAAGRPPRGRSRCAPSRCATARRTAPWWAAWSACWTGSAARTAARPARTSGC